MSNRFILAPAAMSDLDGIGKYLDFIPPDAAQHISSQIQKTLHSIAEAPFRGQAHSAYSSLFGEEVRSRLAGKYRIYYRLSGNTPEILAILHGARDRDAILAERLP